jgi:hypothetical protein
VEFGITYFIYLSAERANKSGGMWNYYLYVLAERAHKSGLFYVGTGGASK